MLYDLLDGRENMMNVIVHQVKTQAWHQKIPTPTLQDVVY
jgi:hypothetical protein